MWDRGCDWVTARFRPRGATTSLLLLHRAVVVVVVVSIVSLKAASFVLSVGDALESKAHTSSVLFQCAAKRFVIQQVFRGSDQS